MKDLVGRKFVVGQKVAYGGRKGSHGYMSVGEIVNIGTATISARLISTSGWADPGRVNVLQRPERAVILEDFVAKFEDK